MSLTIQDTEGLSGIAPEDFSGSLARDTLAVADFVAEDRINSSPLQFESNLIVTSSIEFQKNNIAFTNYTMVSGWNMIGYTLPHAQNVVETMDKIMQLKIQETLSGTKAGFALWKNLDRDTAVGLYGTTPSDKIISSIILPDNIPLSVAFEYANIEILKDNAGAVWFVEFGFNGIGNFQALEGYQIKLQTGGYVFYDDDFGETFAISNILVNTPITFPAFPGSGNEFDTREELITALNNSSRDFRNGWNMFGFPRLHTETDLDMLTEFIPGIHYNALLPGQGYPVGTLHSGSGTIRYAPYDFDTANSTLTTTQRDNEIINTGSRLYGIDLDKVYHTGLENWNTMEGSSITANSARNIYIDHDNTRHELLRLDPYLYTDEHGDYILTSVIDLPVTQSIEDLDATLLGSIIFTEGMNGGPSGSNSEVETYLDVHDINSEEHETHYPRYHLNWDVEQTDDPNIDYNITGVNVATVHGIGTQFTKDFIGYHNAYRHIYSKDVTPLESSQIQVIPITAGWNMISFYIDLSKAPYAGIGFYELFTNHLYTTEDTQFYGNNAYRVPNGADQIEIIKNVSGKFWTSEVDNLSGPTNTEGYMCNSDYSTTMYLQIQGKIIEPVGVDLHTGWNILPIHHPVGLSIADFMDINNTYNPQFESSVEIIKNVTGKFWTSEVDLLSELGSGIGFLINVLAPVRARFYLPNTVSEQFRKGTKFAFDTLGRKFESDVINVVNDELMYVKSVTTGETDPLSQTDSDVDTTGVTAISFRDDGADESTYNNAYTQSGHVTLDRNNLTLSGTGTQFTKIFKSGSLIAFDFTSSVSTSNGARAFDFAYRNWATIKNVESDTFARLNGMNAEIRADLHVNIEANWNSETYLSNPQFFNTVTSAVEPTTLTTPWYYTTSAETSFYYTNRHTTITSSAYLGEVKLRKSMTPEDFTLVKNSVGDVVWPEFGFNGIGNINPGEGYQVKTVQRFDDVQFPTHSAAAYNIPLIDQ